MLAGAVEAPHIAQSDIVEPLVTAAVEDLTVASMLIIKLQRRMFAEAAFERKGHAEKVLRAEQLMFALELRGFGRAVRERIVALAIVNDVAEAGFECPVVREILPPQKADTAEGGLALGVERSNKIGSRRPDDAEELR